MKAAVQIFLSYAREDRKKIENLYRKLSDARFKPWMDIKDLLPGENWELALLKAIQRSDFVLVCLSANSVSKRGYFQKEVKEVLDIARKMLDTDIYLIPVRLEECEVPENLCKFQWIDLFEKDGFTRLVEALQEGMRRRAKVEPELKAVKHAEKLLPDKLLVEKWLRAFPSPLVYNPFETVSAEDDLLLNYYFFEHPVYRQLLDYSSQSVALFADPGGGKTSCRRMFKSSLVSPPNLVVEYTNFGELEQDVVRVSVEDPAQGILRQASAMLGVELESLSPLPNDWQGKVRRFLKNARSKGYTSVHVLVDDVLEYDDPRVTWVATLLIMHLAESFGLFTPNSYVDSDTANLYFKFFLPASFKKCLLKYSGFTTGRIRIVDMVWDENLLQEVIKARLKAASSPGSLVDSLIAFTSELWPPSSRWSTRTQQPMTLDSLLVWLAQNSPRRLITSVNRLFQHRAQIWHESGGNPDELYITMADWATLLEHLLRRGDVI